MKLRGNVTSIASTFVGVASVCKKILLLYYAIDKIYVHMYLREKNNNTTKSGALLVWMVW